VHKEGGGEGESRCSTKVDVVGVEVAAEALLLLAARHVRCCFALLTCLGRATRLAGGCGTHTKRVSSYLQMWPWPNARQMKGVDGDEFGNGESQSRVQSGTKRCRAVVGAKRCC
jgi:hypothetical protein